MASAKASEEMLQKLQRGSILRIKHKGFHQQQLEHYAVVCNVNPITDELILLGIITSDLDAQFVPRLRSKFGNSTIVSISPAFFPQRLTYPSIINCNAPVIRKLCQLIQEVDSGEATFYDIPARDSGQIALCVQGMLDSKLLTEAQKKKIRENCL